RRLFERLQQRVEGRGREHVYFVDDVNLEPAACGAEPDALPQVANLLHLVVARAVDLQHLHIIARGDGAATGARVARGRCRLVGVLAVEALRQDAGGTGLPDAAGAGEEVRVCDAAGFECVFERTRNVLLPDQFGELLRAVAPRNHGVRGDLRGGRRG